VTNPNLDAPEVVIERLPQYLRALSQLVREGVEVISSQQLGERLQVTSAQIRKDLSYFGRFGKQGRGYSIPHLVERLSHILGLDHPWSVAVVGIGRLGRAIIIYPGFAPEGFHVACAFDADPGVVGQIAGGLTIQPLSRMAEVLAQEQVRIAIVAVPAAQAQEVIDRLVESGIKAILSYAPVATQTPSDVHLRSIDPVLALQSMTYYLDSPQKTSQTAV
jgi:redox-sensing transcriptional repressor